MPSRRSRAIVALHGVDGTGKSTQASLLAQRLSMAGVPAVVVWNRWTPQSVGLVRRFLRRTALGGGADAGSHEAADSVAEAVALRPAIAYLFLKFSWLEYLAQTRWRLLMQTCGSDVVVMDRYVADMVVDRARRLAWKDGRIAYETELAYRRGFPRPALTIILDAPLDTIIGRRPEEQPRALRERALLYRRVAEALGAPIVDADGTVDSVAERIWAVVASEWGLAR